MTRPRSGFALALFGLCAVALWLRVSQIPQVFVNGEVLPAAVDANHHLDRIVRSVATFPRVPVDEPGLNWPHGAVHPWGPGFDWMGAGLAMLAGASETRDQIARAASFLPVLLGLVLVLATAALGRTLGGRRVGLCAAAIVAVLPQAVAIARVGRVDHHVAEGLAMLGLGAWALGAVRERTGAASAIRFEALGSAIALWSGAVYTGSLLYVALAAALVIGGSLLRREPTPLLGSGAAGLGLAALGLCVLQHDAVAFHGMPLAFYFPSYFQPACFALAGFGVAVAALASRIGHADPLRCLALRASVFAAAVVGLGSALMLGVPGLAVEVRAGTAGWLGRGDEWIASIDEFLPLVPSLALWTAEAWSRVYEYLGVFGLLAPLLVPAGLVAIVRRDPARGTAFVAWTLVGFVLALWEARFARVFHANLAICAAASLVVGARAALGAAGADRPGPRSAALAAILVALVLADPALHRRFTWADARTPAPAEQAALFLRGLEARPDDAVLTTWELGSTVRWVARRPTLVGGFGPTSGLEAFATSESFAFGDEASMLRVMDERGLGFVLAGASTVLRRMRPDEKPWPVARLPDGRMALDPSWMRAHPAGALMIGGSGWPDADLPHLTGLRPRFASSGVLPGRSGPLPLLWVYERVPGARVEGRAAPGARVEARLEIHTSSGTAPYIAWTRADANGRFTLQLPLPSGLEGPLGTGAAYRIDTGTGPPETLRVPDHATREGSVILLASAGSTGSTSADPGRWPADRAP